MEWPAFGHGRPALVARFTLVALGLSLALALGCDSSGTIVVRAADSGHDSKADADADATGPDSDDAGVAQDASFDTTTDATDAAGDTWDADDAQLDAPIDGEADADASGAMNADASDASAPPADSASDTAAADSTLAADATGAMDAMDGSVDATLRDTATADTNAAMDSGFDAADTNVPVDSGTITCTTTRQVPFANGCSAMVTVEDDVGLFPVSLPSLGWAGGLGTNSSGISQLYTNNSVPNPGQQLLLATDKSLTLYVGYTMIPGDGGPNDWGTAQRTENEITSFTLNAMRQGTLPPNCFTPEIAVQCSGRTTIGCQWYGLPCRGAQTCCPDSIFTPIGDAGPWPVACTANLCCNPAGAACYEGVACCSGMCSGDAGSSGRTCL